MAFLIRIGKLKLHQTSLLSKIISNGSLLLLQNLYQAVSHPRLRLAENPYQSVHNNLAGFGNGVRFFAAPVQFLKREIELVKTRVDEEITAEFVRLVTEDGHSVVPIQAALLSAKKANLQLVEVNGKSNPPVCKIMDYQKEKATKEKKEKEASKSKGEKTLRPGAPKEIRFSGKTEQNDLEIKAGKIKLLLEDGYRVKCSAKGSSETEVLGTLTRLCDLIEDVAAIETAPILGNRSAHLVIKHIKYSQKKGRAKRLKDITDETSGLLVPTPPFTEDNTDLENDGEEFTDQASRAKNEADKKRSGGPNTAGSSGATQSRYSNKGSTDHWNLNPSPGLREGQSTRPIDIPRPEPSGAVQNRYSKRDSTLHRGTTYHRNPNSNQGSQQPESAPGEGESREFNRYGARTSRQGRFNR